MFGNDALRDRLRRLVLDRRNATPDAGDDDDDADEKPVRRRRKPPGVPDYAGAASGAPEVGVEEFLPGGEWRGRHGTVYVHERLRSTMERRRPHWGVAGDPPAEEEGLMALAHVGLERALFLDLETGGLASSPVFLAGTMHWNGSDFVLRQYFARNYAEEAALLEALGEAAAGFDFVVTFNGKSYDSPFLQQRAIRHGVRMTLPPHHLDLLHVARRRWRQELPDCRLQTLERRICRRHRAGDVPSDEVPALYHDFVRHGDPYRLIPVFHHNLLDVITMAELLHALSSRPKPRWFDLESLTPP
jgi:uncharacterized protein YprB with RNaseH-like and TPR domain